MTVRADFDELANEAEEAAIRARFGRLSGPAALGLATDCIDTATDLIEAGKLISEGGLGIPHRHRAFGSDARDLREVAPRLGPPQGDASPEVSGTGRGRARRGSPPLRRCSDATARHLRSAHRG
jgi:hypothetical protein